MFNLFFSKGPHQNSYFSIALKPNTILTYEIIYNFTQEFFNRVLKDSTISLIFEVVYTDGRTYQFASGQVVNNTVLLSDLVDIIFCFWDNRTVLLDGEVLRIRILFSDKAGSRAGKHVRLISPTLLKPTRLDSNYQDTGSLIAVKDNRYTPNTILPLTGSGATENFRTIQIQGRSFLVCTSTDSNSTTDSLPRVIEFKNLDQPKILKAAKEALKGMAGVYAYINNITGAVYIGSSINLARRLVQHVVNNSTNPHLRNAISKYGLENFTLVVVEIFQVDPDVSMGTNKASLLAMEQVYLKWGSLSLPKELFYNFYILQVPH